MRRRVGRRGAVLLLEALLHACYGLALTIPRLGPTAGYYVAIERLASYDVWGAVWIASAALGVVQALRHDTIASAAFVTMSALPAMWAAGLVLGALHSGELRGVVIGILFAVLSLRTMVVAGWPEPRRPQ